MEYDSFITHKIDMFMGKPKSGKTLIAGSYPKPMLYISVGNDGGGRVLARQYARDVKAGLLRVKDLRNDPPIGGKINKTSIDKLAEVLRDLRKPDADKFNTIVIDTVGALQDDYKTYLEFSKGGKRLSTDQWGDVSKMMMSIKDNMKRFSEENGAQFVWIFHTSEQEMYETSGLNKEIRVVPDVTIKSGVKFMKDASNIFYCCRKTVVNEKGERDVRFLTYVGPHPLMDTGTRDLVLSHGGFVENFTYEKWQQMVDNNSLQEVEVLSIENTEQKADDKQNVDDEQNN